MATALDLVLPATITDTTLPNPSLADPLLDGAAAGGIRFIFDLAAGTSWVKQAAPISGDAVIDLAAVGNGTVEMSGTGPTFAGGGFDFTGITAKGDDVLAPACLAPIKAAANQYFMVVEYVKLPTSGNWVTAGAGANPPFFVATSGGGGYTAEADLLTIMQTPTPSISARRQTNGGSTVDNLTLSGTACTRHQGLVVQLAFWRNATNQTFRIRSSAGTDLVTAAVGSNNTGDFSAKQPRFGVVSSLSSASRGVWDNWRLYRGWVADLNVETRDPATLADTDYTNTITNFASAPRFT